LCFVVKSTRKRREIPVQVHYLQAAVQQNTSPSRSATNTVRSPPQSDSSHDHAGPGHVLHSVSGAELCHVCIDIEAQQHTADGVGDLTIILENMGTSHSYPIFSALKWRNAAPKCHLRPKPCPSPSPLSFVSQLNIASFCRSRVPRMPPTLWNPPPTLAKIRTPPSISRLGYSKTSRSL